MVRRQQAQQAPLPGLEVKAKSTFQIFFGVEFWQAQFEEESWNPTA